MRNLPARPSFAGEHGQTALRPLTALLALGLSITTAAAFSVTRTSSEDAFYISSKFSTNNVGGMYAAYLVDNDTGSSYNDIWVTVDSFTGGLVGLAPNEDGVYQLGAMASGASKMVYFYLAATTTGAIPQSHTTRIYDRRPDLPGAVQLDNAAFMFANGVADSIEAAANKVDALVSGPDPPIIGGIVTLTVSGRTGTVGTNDLLLFTPAAHLSWPASTYEAFRSDITLTNIQGSSCGSTVLGNFVDDLEITWSQTSCYTAIYKFRATAITPAVTEVSPLVHIASGTQIKHTDPSGYTGIAPISPADNTLVLAKISDVSAVFTGGTVTYTLTLTNSASNAVCPVETPTCNDLTVEDFVDTLPTSPGNPTYVSSSSTFGGNSIPDPSIAGAVLTWVGAFVVPAGGSASLTYQVTMPGTVGSYSNSAVANIGTKQIDTTLSTTDDQPASTTVDVDVDTDSDSVPDSSDNCPADPNTTQDDGDGDGVGDVCDNCPSDSNATQDDADGDGAGDVCDVCPGSDDAVDADGDGVPDGCDICAGFDDSVDADGDGVPDGCDACPGSDDTVDTDGDGVPDGCDFCVGFDDAVDADGDGVPDGCDACPGSDDALDADGDGVPDDCDICDGFDDAVDLDGDGVPDGCDICPGADDAVDSDGDGVPDGCDVCAGFDDAVDADGDGVPDGCDACPGSDDALDADGDGVPDGCDACPGSDDTVDTDGDGVPDGCDVCAGFDDAVDPDGDGVPNGCDICAGADDAVDADGDGVPDGCDACPGSDDALDADGDGVPDGCDICPGSDDTVDADGDGVPDGCDICAGADDAVDADGDGVPDGCDACPGFDDAMDADGDSTPDGCDVCSGSDDTVDTDGDSVPDGCDICAGSDDAVDADGDGVPDGCDACPGFDDALDADGDGTPDGCDVCPGSNDAADADGDGVPDGCDICPGADDAVDSDGDGVSDGCDVCAGFDDAVDVDGDGVPDGCDACPGSDDALDADGDGVPDGCDICAGFDDTVDPDGDGVPDGCDVCAGFDDAVDTDGDGVPDGCDACPGSDDALDADGDGVPDGCDICAGFDDAADPDGDGIPDGCDVCPAGDDTADADGDGVPDGCDACPGSDDALDADGDGVPDACDACPGSNDASDADGDGVPDGCDICAGSNDAVDSDGDGVPDGCDVCSGSDDAADADGDGAPDGCDACPGSDDAMDADGDGVPDGCDICAGFDDAVDADGDGTPDGCDACPAGDDTADADGDGVPDGCDVCPGSDDAVDTDGDGVPDGCDLCPGSDDALDADGDGVPDGCDTCPGFDDTQDADGDGICDGADNCPSDANASQDDLDADAVGNACDIDDDGDGLLDADEGLVDSDLDGNPDSLDIDADGDGIPDNIEAQPSLSAVPPANSDSDNDGLDDAYDPDSGGTPLVPVGTDTDGVPDYLDDDSDDDGVPDSIEGHDANQDGVADTTPLGTDADGDGLDDAYDSSPGPEPDASNAAMQDTDGDLQPDWRDTDDDDDGIPTPDEDYNQNGDFTDDDLDGDGTPDYLQPPFQGGQVLLSKQAARQVVSVGEMVGYVLTAENTSGTGAVVTDLSDHIPPGFSYVNGSARLRRAGSDNVLGTVDDDVQDVDPRGNRPIVFESISLSASEEVQLSYLLRVGSGVTPGDYVNEATPLSAAGLPIGNTATETVAVEQDVVLDRTTIVGKVFHDRDGDGWQDSAHATGVMLRVEAEAGVLGEGARVRRDGNDIAWSGSLSEGLDLGVFPGRRSSDQPLDGRQSVVRLPLNRQAPVTVTITTDEGTEIRLSGDNHITPRHRGMKRRGLTAQDLHVQQRVEMEDGEPVLVITVTNVGVHDVGIPGVRIATVTGLLVETDAHGRYHIADVDGGRRERGRNMPLKLDLATLPPGSTLTTENPRVVRVTPGLASKANFGVQLPLWTLSQARPSSSSSVPGAAPAFPTSGAPAGASSDGDRVPADDLETRPAGDGRLHAAGNGALWITEDPAVVDPRLDVRGPDRAVLGAQGLVEPMEFRTYCNYPDFLERWELVLFRVEDADLVRPLATLSGDHLGFVDSHRWDGATESGAGLRVDQELLYVLRVYDADGRMDETYPRTLRLVGDAGRHEEESAAAVPFGSSNLRVQNIPIRGSRVRIHGADLEPNAQVQVDGHPVLVDEDGNFSVERLLPPGEHRFQVRGSRSDGQEWQQEATVDVRGSYFFMVGLADLTVGENNVSGHMEPLGMDDHFDEEVFVDGRVAFYLKAKVKGKYLITAQLDTTEDELNKLWDKVRDEDPREVFRHLDEDRYYPVYGDDSTTIEDVPSQGQMYLRVDWDKSRVLWGNYQTGVTGNEFAQYNRTLYGAQYQHRSLATTKHGDDRTQLNVFASEAQTALAHNRFAATGGSLYYLQHTRVVQGSEKMHVEVLDRDSRLVVENIALERGRDYEIDELQGRVILYRPLTQVAAQAAPSIIKDQPLEGNDVFLLVDYEYEPQGFDADNVTMGARGKVWAGDNVGIGATYVEEPRAGEDYTLRGADVTWKLGRGTYIKGEYAETEATQVSAGLFSDDGGLSFTDLPSATPDEARHGEAKMIEARVNLGELTDGAAEATIGAWWKDRSAGFSTARTDDGVGSTEYGAEVDWHPTEDLRVAGRASVVEREDTQKRTTESVQVDYQLTEKTRLGAEVRHESTELAGGDDVEGTLLGLGIKQEITERVNLFGTVQTTVQDDSGYQDNDLVSVGVTAPLTDRGDIRLEAVAGDRGEALKVGASWDIRDDHEIYGTLTLSPDSTANSRDAVTVGQRARISNQLRVFTENQFTSDANQSGMGHVFGLDFRPGPVWSLGLSVQSSELDRNSQEDIDRDVVSLSAGRLGDALRWNSKLEFRRDRGDLDLDQWLTTNTLSYKKNESWLFLGKASLSWTEDQNTDRNDARFVETSAGVAFRPIYHDRLNLLGRYTFLYDLPAPEQLPLRTDQRVHVLSAEALYDLTARWALGGKIAVKQGEQRAERDDGEWFETRADLAVLRLRFRVVRQWDALAEYRWLQVDEAETLRQGILLGVYRPIREHMRLGVGYNFTDFDDDLTRLDYENSGWFFNIVGKY